MNKEHLENDFSEDLLNEHTVPKQQKLIIPKPVIQQPAAPTQAKTTKSTVQPAKRVQQNSKELGILLERQRLFKEAALKAKQEGNVNVALVYLRHAKGFDSMIHAAENGLPLDMTNVNSWLSSSLTI